MIGVYDRMINLNGKITTIISTEYNARIETMLVENGDIRIKYICNGHYISWIWGKYIPTFASLLRKLIYQIGFPVDRLKKWFGLASIEAKDVLPQMWNDMILHRGRLQESYMRWNNEKVLLLFGFITDSLQMDGNQNLEINLELFRPRLEELWFVCGGIYNKNSLLVKSKKKNVSVRIPLQRQEELAGEGAGSLRGMVDQPFINKPKGAQAALERSVEEKALRQAQLEAQARANAERQEAQARANAERQEAQARANAERREAESIAVPARAVPARVVATQSYGLGAGAGGVTVPVTSRNSGSQSFRPVSGQTEQARSLSRGAAEAAQTVPRGIVSERSRPFIGNPTAQPRFTKMKRESYGQSVQLIKNYIQRLLRNPGMEGVSENAEVKNFNKKTNLQKLQQIHKKVTNELLKRQRVLPTSIGSAETQSFQENKTKRREANEAKSAREAIAEREARAEREAIAERAEREAKALNEERRRAANEERRRVANEERRIENEERVRKAVLKEQEAREERERLLKLQQNQTNLLRLAREYFQLTGNYPNNMNTSTLRNRIQNLEREKQSLVNEIKSMRGKSNIEKYEKTMTIPQLESIRNDILNERKVKIIRDIERLKSELENTATLATMNMTFNNLWSIKKKLLANIQTRNRNQ
jgi:hypothetical protein